MKDIWHIKRGRKRGNEIAVYTVTKNKMSDTKQREYRITLSDLWYNIYRRFDNDGMLYLEFLCHNDRWSRNKKFARTFYTKQDAEWYLVLIRRKDKNAESES
jgi:hypothetical protein